MNFVNGKISNDGQEVHVQTEIIDTLKISKGRVFGNSAKNNLILGIRPEKISIHPSRSKIDGGLGGKILDVSYSGETTHYNVQYSTDAKSLTVSIQNAIGQQIYSVGDDVYLQFDKENFIAFRE